MKFIKDWFKRKTDIVTTQVEAPTESTEDFLSRYGETEPVDMVIRYIEDNLDNFTIEIGRDIGAGLYEVCISDGKIKIEGYYTRWEGDLHPSNTVAILENSNRVVMAITLDGLSDHLTSNFAIKVAPYIVKLFNIVSDKKKTKRLKENQESQRQSIEYFTKLLGENK